MPIPRASSAIAAARVYTLADAATVTKPGGQRCAGVPRPFHLPMMLPVIVSIIIEMPIPSASSAIATARVYTLADVATVTKRG